MRPLHISLNTAHSGCKPCLTVSSFTHSLHVFLPLSTHLTPATTSQSRTHFNRPTPNHLHSYVPHAQTISIYNTLPPQPRSEYPKNCLKTSLLFLSFRDTCITNPSQHPMLCSLQAMKILSLYCLFNLISFFPHTSNNNMHVTNKSLKWIFLFMWYDAPRAVRMDDFECNHSKHRQ